MPHGDFSDVAGFLTLALGAGYLFAPQFAFQKIGPLEPALDTAPTAELVAVLRVVGASLVGWGLVLFFNRWNTVNGKAGALSSVIVASSIVYNQLVLDQFAFKPRPQYIAALIFVLAALHLAFNANPTHTWQSLKAEADKKGGCTCGEMCCSHFLF
jgi:hypothetical protein